MAHGIRITDGSSYEDGWEAGYAWNPRLHPQPQPPKLTQRQTARWLAGFRDGCDSRGIKETIDRQKAIRAQEHEAALRRRWNHSMTDR